MDKNYDDRRVAYSTAMKYMFNKIPTTITKPLTRKQKFQKLMVEIGGGWYMVKRAKGIPPLRIPKISKITR